MVEGLPDAGVSMRWLQCRALNNSSDGIGWCRSSTAQLDDMQMFAAAGSGM